MLFCAATNQSEGSSMSKTLLVKLGAVGGACAAIGAGGGILGTSAAATNNGTTTAKHHARHARSLWLRAVHADAIVPVKGGQFVQVTLDRGTVQSVSGQQLTIAEGTKKASYKTVTLTIPGGAIVRDNKQTAQLSDLKAGQRVLVVQGPKNTRVVAHTPRAKTAK
jgi:hypothetical protein